MKQVALVTGASGGLGGELCRQLAADGWRVFGAARSVGQMPAADGIESVSLDVSDVENVTSAVNQICDKAGRIDLLVNCAGTTSDELICRMSEASWNQVIDVNLKGAFLCAKAVARMMMKQRDGHVVNVSSFAAMRGHAGQANYVAAKAGLIGLTQSLASELGARNVRVNAVLPGVMPSRMTERLSEARLKELAAANALNRLNDVSEVARFIVFVATTRNISGQVFNLDSRIAPWT